MIIRQYGDYPITYVPDIGEVLYARRTKIEPFLKAIVLLARRRRDGAIRIKVQWLESNPDAGAWVESPIVAGTVGWVVSGLPGAPRMIMQIDRGARTSAKRAPVDPSP